LIEPKVFCALLRRSGQNKDAVTAGRSMKTVIGQMLFTLNLRRKS